MGLIIKIAWRNIFRHKGKSLVIGAIIFLGAFLMTIGNGVISGMDRGLQKNIVEGFSGDIVVVSDKQENDNVFLEPMGKSVESLNNFKSLDTVLKTVPIVDRWLPIGKNFAMVLNEDGGSADGVFVIGADFARYRAFFNQNLKVVEGRLLNDRERGVLVPTGWRKQMAENYNILFAVDGTPVDTSTLSEEGKKYFADMSTKNSVIYMGLNAENSTTDVRSTVRGIVKYRSLNTIWGNFPVMDIESYRECMGYFTVQSKEVVVKKEDQNLLSMENGSMDDLFADDNIVSTKATEKTNVLAAGSLIVKNDTLAREVDLDAGAYNLVLLRLKDSRTLDKSVKELNAIFKDKKLGLRAIPWQKAVGTIGSMAVLIKTSLFVFVMFLFFVAIIIIVNTLSMAALERTNEIGMMRAVGARKGFVSAMFFGETTVLSFFFGGIGIVAGAIVVWVLRLLHLSTDNDMLQLLYGGDTFSPFLSAPDIAMAVIQLAIVTLIAVVYPLSVARKITPLEAIARD